MIYEGQAGYEKKPDIEFNHVCTALGVDVRSNEPLPQEEADEYVRRGRDTFQRLRGVTVMIDGDDACIWYDIMPGKFERIRRITGYLVGTLDRFNDAKRAEESERVKHDLS